MRAAEEAQLQVDVAINYYGKPYQTLLTIETLLEHSGQHIDRIYLIRELKQPREEQDISGCSPSTANASSSSSPNTTLHGAPPISIASSRMPHIACRSATSTRSRRPTSDSSS